MRRDPEKRSAHAATERRVRQPWTKDADFRVLSLDGGGIKGIYTAAALARLEARTGRPSAELFDLIVGTSTGGLLAIGLAAGIPARELLDFYIDRGREIFPPVGWVRRKLRWCKSILVRRFARRPLEKALEDVLGADMKLKDILPRRICVQAFDGHHGEVVVYKTPHHPAYVLDGDKRSVDVALATTAAPSFFAPHIDERGHILADGGLWANNPVLVGIVEAVSAFDVDLEQIRVLSIGCGDSHRPFGFFKRAAWASGLWFWRDAVFTAMRLQSQSALGQAKHLVGPENLVRVDVRDTAAAAIEMDDYACAVRLLPDLGGQDLETEMRRIRAILGLEADVDSSRSVDDASATE